MPTFKFTSPEGKVYQVTGPEGSTKEQAFSKFKEMRPELFGKAKAKDSGEIPTRQPAKQPTTEPAPESLAASGVYDFLESPTAKALGALPGPFAALGAISAPTEKAGLMAGMAQIPETIGSKLGLLEKGRAEESLKQLIGIPQESGAFQAGQFVGETVPTMMVPVGAARALKMIPGATTSPYVNKLLTAMETGGFGKLQGAAPDASMLARLGQNARNYLTNIAGGAAGGVLTGGLTQGDIEGLKEGAITGAGMPAVLRPLGSVATGAGKAARYISGKVEDVKASDKAKLAEVAGNKINDLITQLKDAADVVPGYQAHAGEAAIKVGSPGFSSLVADVLERAKSDNDVAAVLADRDATNKLALKMYQDGLVKSVDDANKMLAKAVPKQDIEAIGGKLGERRKALVEAEKAKAQPFYEKAKAFGGDINASELGDIASQIRNKHTDLVKDLDTETLGLIDKLKPTVIPAKKDAFGIEYPERVEPPKITMEEAIALDQAIGREYGPLSKSSESGARIMAKDLMSIKERLDQVIKNNVPKNIYESFAKGKEQYRKNVIEPFYESEFQKMAMKGSFGQPRLQPSEVVKRVFAKPEFATQFIRQFGKDPESVKAASQGVEELFRKTVMPGDTLNLNAAKSFLQKNMDTLNKLEASGIPSKSAIEQFMKKAHDTEVVANKVAQNAKLLGEFNPNLSTPARESKIADLTKGLTPAQIQDVDAIKKTIDQTDEFERLAKFGKEQGDTIFSDQVQKMPALLKTWATVVRAVQTAVGSAMDEKKTIELAKTFLEPKATTKALLEAKAWQASKQAKLAKLTEKGRKIGEAGQMGGRVATATIQNKLADDRNKNALAR